MRIWHAPIAARRFADPKKPAQSRRRALELHPHPEPHSNLLFEMNFLAATTPEKLYAEACRWNSLYAEPLAVGDSAAHATQPIRNAG